MRKLKICIVSDFFVPHYQGGGERRYYEILKRLSAKGHLVDLLCMRIKGVEDEEVIEGIKVHHIGPKIEKPPQRGLMDFLRFSVASLVWVLRQKYDVVEGHGIGLVPVSLAGLFTKAKSVAMIHDLSSGVPDQWIGFSRLSELGEKLLIRLPFFGFLLKMVLLAGSQHARRSWRQWLFSSDFLRRGWPVDLRRRTHRAGTAHCHQKGWNQ